MAMSMQERKAAQRARPLGYAKSRECDWRMQGIREANYVSFLAKLTIQNFKCHCVVVRLEGERVLTTIMQRVQPGVYCAIRAIYCLENLKLEVPSF